MIGYIMKQCTKLDNGIIVGYGRMSGSFDAQDMLRHCKHPQNVAVVMRSVELRLGHVILYKGLGFGEQF